MNPSRILSLFLAVAFACQISAAAERLTVFAGNYPLIYFAERIGGPLVDARFPVPPDSDPGYWKPTDQDVIAMQKAEAVFLNGATYEKWFSKVSLPSSILYTTTREFEKDFIVVKGAVTHTHGNGKTHAHDGIASTTWLDMKQARLQAESILEVLIRKLPGEKKLLKKNYEGLAKELKDLGKQFGKAGKALGKVPLFASHPVYQYAERAYGLDLESVHWEPGIVPDSKELASFQETLKSHPARWMIWEGTPKEESVAKLTELGVGSIVFDPCGNRPEEGDWLFVMKQNLAALQSIAE
ncbi:MAG: metal ABC transporter substrate-binding protein [Verrucomicrobiales bacterium]|nr:metal ABC transporter substrate-binding protein [Verrucomicrobiales bacterium]